MNYKQFQTNRFIREFFDILCHPFESPNGKIDNYPHHDLLELSSLAAFLKTQGVDAGIRIEETSDPEMFHKAIRSMEFDDLFFVRGDLTAEDIEMSNWDVFSSYFVYRKYSEVYLMYIPDLEYLNRYETVLSESV